MFETGIFVFLSFMKLFANVMWLSSNKQEFDLDVKFIIITVMMKFGNSGWDVPTKGSLIATKIT